MRASPTRVAVATRAIVLGIAFLSVALVLNAARSASADEGHSKSSLVHESSSHGTTSYSYSTTSSSESEDDFAYAIVGPDANVLVGTWSESGIESIRRATGPSARDLLWFSLGGRNYVVRDRAIISRAERVAGPMQKLGRGQGRLGAIQGELGRKHAEIGAEQARIGVRLASLSVRRTRTSTRETEEIENELGDLERQQGELEEKQAPLSRRQEELGRRQSDLGHQQEQASAHARSEMRRLADEAIESGKAERAAD